MCVCACASLESPKFRKFDGSQRQPPANEAHNHSYFQTLDLENVVAWTDDRHRHRHRHRHRQIPCRQTLRPDVSMCDGVRKTAKRDDDNPIPAPTDLQICTQLLLLLLLDRLACMTLECLPRQVLLPIAQRFERAAALVLQLEYVSDLVASLQEPIEVVLVVGRTHAESHARLDQRCRRIGDDDDGNLALQHLVTERRHLCRVVQQEGDDGRVVVAVDDEAQFLQAQMEVDAVERQSLHALDTVQARNLECYTAERRTDLLDDDWRHCFREHRPGVGQAKGLDHVLIARDVATGGTKRLCKSPHQDVHLRWRDAVKVAHTPATPAECAYRMCLVNKQVELVLLLQLDESGQVAHGALHGVQPLDNDEDLPPWPVRPWLSLGDDFAEQFLERLHAVVVKDPDRGARQPRTPSDTGMVEFVRDDQAALPDECGEDGRIHTETL